MKKEILAKNSAMPNKGTNQQAPKKKYNTINERFPR